MRDLARKSCGRFPPHAVRVSAGSERVRSPTFNDTKRATIACSNLETHRRGGDPQAGVQSAFSSGVLIEPFSLACTDLSLAATMCALLSLPSAAT